MNVGGKLANVPDQFSALPEKGTHEKVENMPYFSNVAVDHIQGYTQYQSDKMYFVFTHSLDGRGSGRIIVKHGMKDQHQEIRTPEGWNHPGGIQMLGKYLFVPCEKKEGSMVFVYDLEEKKLDPVVKLSFWHRAGCVGITELTHNGTPHYCMVIGDKTNYHAYIMKVPDDMKNLTYDGGGLGTFTLENIPKKDNKIDCQGFGLVTDTTNNKVYMVALHGRTKVTTYEDWAYLIPLSVKSPITIDASAIKSKHLISTGHVGGVAGTHFRWGAGIRVTPGGKLVILATSRNIISEGTGNKNYLDTNYWV